MSEKLNVSKQKNIIWILCDSVRVYSTDEDERGRLQAMDEFAIDAIDFRTAVTAAPSTIMSVSSMLTGVAPPYLSRDYAGFKGHQEAFESFPQMLRDNGYATYALLFLPDARIFLEPIFGDTCKEIMGGDSVQDEFSNDVMLEKFDLFLESDRVNDPFFVWLHLNCRGDPDLTSKVSDLLSKLKEFGLYDDSVIILNSDHGYPDPSRGISYYDKRKYGHDLIMSDDNILAPQLLKIPGVSPQRVDAPISTFDLFPTIFDYLGIPVSNSVQNFGMTGRSLRAHLEGRRAWDSRLHRTDTRFIFQPNAAISIRNNQYKYIFYESDLTEEFFDIVNDPFESNNLILDETLLDISEQYRSEFYRQQKDIISYHASILGPKFKNIVGLSASFILIGDFNQNFITTYNEIFEVTSVEFNKNKLKEITILEHNATKKPDYVIAFPCSKDPFVNTTIFKTSQRLHKIHNGSRMFVVNYNLDIIDSPRHWLMRLFEKPRQYYLIFKRDPKGAIFTVYIDFGRLFKKFKNILK